MERIGPFGRVTSSAGNVDHNGDVMDAALLERLRTQVGPHLTPDVNPDDQAKLVAAMVEAGRAGLTPAVVIGPQWRRRGVVAR